jgi:dienelactone hydrolase
VATPKKTAFQLTGSDGGPIRGEVRTAGMTRDRPAVVICHGFKGFKDWGMFPQLAARIAHAGLTAVTFNFSGSGVGEDGESFSEPSRFAHDTYTRQLDDLSAVLRALKEARLVAGTQSPGKIGLFGHSRGGGVAVLMTARDPDIQALVTWASISTVRRWDPEIVKKWRAEGKLDVVNARTGQVLPLSTDILDDIDRHASGALNIPAAAARITVPWLIIHGDSDEAVSLDDAKVLHKGSGERAKLHVIRGGGHTFGARHPWQGTTAELDEAMDATLSWLVKNLV